jgi:hypothetical protein
MMPKLNEFGDVEMLKIGKRQNGKAFSEERKALETYYEYFIEEMNEIESFVNMFATNVDNFDYKSLITEQEIPLKTESSPLIIQ